MHSLAAVALALSALGAAAAALAGAYRVARPERAAADQAGPAKARG